MGTRLIFVSCGQLIEEERTLGRRIKAEIDAVDGYEGYFADAVQDFTRPCGTHLGRSPAIHRGRRGAASARSGCLRSRSGIGSAVVSLDQSGTRGLGLSSVLRGNQHPDSGIQI